MDTFERPNLFAIVGTGTPLAMGKLACVSQLVEPQGRIIIPLMMHREGLISSPCFFLSAFFDQNNIEYGDHLLGVSALGDWSGWCRFFLHAVTDQVKQNRDRARGMYDLNRRLKRELAEQSGSVHAQKVVDRLFSAAIFRTSEFVNGIPDVGPQTVRSMLRILEKDIGALHILEEQKGRRSSIMIFPELLRFID